MSTGTLNQQRQRLEASRSSDNLWLALDNWEKALAEKSLLKRFHEHTEVGNDDMKWIQFS